MARTYAYVERGCVMEIIPAAHDAAGGEVPIAQRYHAGFVARLVDVTNLDPAPAMYWRYDESTGEFTPGTEPPDA